MTTALENRKRTKKPLLRADLTKVEAKMTVLSDNVYISTLIKLWYNEVNNLSVSERWS